MNAQVRRMSMRVPMAAALACAAALPLTLNSASAHQSAPTHRVLLATTDDLGSVESAVTSAGGTVVASYAIAKALLADMPENAATPQGAYVVPNVGMTFNALPTAAAGGSDSENTFKQTIGAPDNGGKGVSVAVVDTGVDPDADVTVSDRANTSGGPAGDGYGHGTFMAGLVAGDDAQYGGVAPAASVYDVQVAAQDGSTDMSKVLAGLQAVADKQAADPSLRVAMLALNTQSPLPPHLDPLTRALDRLWARGMTVVVASGNDGKNSLSSPATDPTLLVVGAQDEVDTAARGDDVVADFSAYGKAFGVSRPDLVAPGVSLISTSPLNSQAYTQNPNSVVKDGYLKGTGTSMSSAVTAGAVATLLSARPSLTPDNAKRLLVGTAYSTSGAGAGSGGLDLGAAMSAPLSRTDSTRPGPWDNQYGPSESDAQTWAQFSEAWAAGDLAAVAEAWTNLSEQTRKWAANAWSMAVVVNALQADEATWDGRRWGGARWISQNWEGRRWGTDEWVGRRWGNAEWMSSVWDGRRWGGAQWASTDWLAFAWTLRMGNTEASMQELWKSEVWEGRRWGSADWQGRRWGSNDWQGRRWGSDEWVGRRWGSEAWDGRRWGSGSWDGRRWGSGSWDGRRWGSFTFEGRRWGNDTWDGRRWGALDW